jgi:cytochrome P450
VESIIKDDSDITYENLKKLIYIDWIQNETTRYYGPGTGIFPRIATVDNKIGNVPITKGTVVTIQPVSNHFNPSYFEEPYRFCP